MQHLPLDLSGLSARNRRILALGIRGADGDDPAVELDALLARAGNIADLSDTDLGEIEAGLTVAARELLASPSDEVIAQVDEIIVARDAIRTAAAERITAAETLQTAAAERLALLDGPEDDEPEGEAPEGDEPDPAADPEAIETPAPEAEPLTPAAESDAEVVPLAASAPATTRARRPAATRPLPKAAPEFKLIASANAPGTPAGLVLDTNERVFSVFENALRASGGQHVGAALNMPLFSLGAFNPEEIYGEPRTLGRDARANHTKIAAVTSRKALRASGGICAPVPVQYDLPVFGTDARPVRDAFARFAATRGGVRVLPGVSLSELAGAIGVWTEANDTAPSSPATKPCLVMTCPEETEVLVAAITKCLKVGNFRNMFFPEQVAAWVELAGVQLARVAETRLLQKVGDESTQIAVTEILGTVRTMLATLDRAGASLRSHHRLDPEFPLRLLAPAWLLDNMLTDLIRQAPGDNVLGATDALISSFFASRNINVTWFLDGEANEGQIFADQVDGALNGWPNHVVAYLYPEGSWLHLDAGMLDFGIVRDSTLNATNDFQIFSEIFEESIFHGVPGTSYRLEIDICPSGQAAALDDTSAICTAGS